MAVDKERYVSNPIKGDSFIVYQSLSYALCGNEDMFENIINDCLVVFKQFPMLYNNRISYAAQKEGERNLRSMSCTLGSVFLGCI